MTNQHKDKYSGFAELAQYERKGKDFRILVANRNSDTTILAPHGGKIESMTSEIARAVAGQEFNLYCFEGIKKNRNYETLHITSHRFDEPDCIQLLSHSQNVFAIHGCDGDHKTIYIGGRNKTMRKHLALKLQEAGLTAQENDHAFPGKEENNICNRGVTGEGTQLELTRGLRNSSAINEFVKILRAMILLLQSPYAPEPDVAARRGLNTNEKRVPSSENDLTCEDCGCEVSGKDAFCPECGGIFTSPTFCATHPGVEAEGVCVICHTGFCAACGSRVSKLFLCNIHSRYEIMEGKARVFGSLDNVQAQYATRCLEHAGLHPFFYSRRYNPGPAVNPFFAWRLFGNHVIQELKVFVPFSEVQDAEKILVELKLFDGSESAQNKLKND